MNRKRITITVGDNDAIFYMDVNEDVAIDSFQSFVKYLVTVNREDYRKPQDNGIIEKFVSSHGKPPEETNDAVGPKEISEKVAVGDKGTDTYKKKSLIFYKCKCSDRCSYGIVVPGEDIKCRCGEIHKTDKLLNGYYRCVNCGRTAKFKVIEGTPFEEISCKSCDSLIDMKWNDRVKEFINLDM